MYIYTGLLLEEARSCLVYGGDPWYLVRCRYLRFAASSHYLLFQVLPDDIAHHERAAGASSVVMVVLSLSPLFGNTEAELLL